MPTARAASTAAKKSTATAAKSTSRSAAKTATTAKAAPAAKKATASRSKAAPATASRRGRGAPLDEDEDLLAGMDDGGSVAEDDDDESFDLLSDLSEDNGTPWYPWDDEDQPDGIQGTVKYIGEVEREQRFGGGMAPYVEIEDKNDPEQIWAVRGYATVLANQLNRAIEAGLSAGDVIAIKYFGEKQNRSGDNAYKNFKVVTKKK